MSDLEKHESSVARCPGEFIEKLHLEPARTLLCTPSEENLIKVKYHVSCIRKCITMLEGDKGDDDIDNRESEILIEYLEQQVAQINKQIQEVPVKDVDQSMLECLQLDDIKHSKHDLELIQSASDVTEYNNSINRNDVAVCDVSEEKYNEFDLQILENLETDLKSMAYSIKNIFSEILEQNNVNY